MREKIKYLFQILILAACLLPLTGCGSAKQPVPLPAAGHSPASPGISSEDQQRVIDKLYAQLEEWQGVPHHDGGLSKQGVDCSGFTYLTFRQLFDVRLPRSTSQLAHTGSAVSMMQLQPGDLVFFKITMGGRHVGIYLEEQKFIHAAKSKGVMVSRLDNPYWQKHYWQARRVASL
jgi:cell wall-associated NlpC family hydrolase